MSSHTSRGYWVCQGVGWSLYSLLNTVAFGALTGERGTAAALSVGLSALGLALTHLLRHTVARGWKPLGLGALVPRMVAASLVRRQRRGAAPPQGPAQPALPLQLPQRAARPHRRGPRPRPAGRHAAREPAALRPHRRGRDGEPRAGA